MLLAALDGLERCAHATELVWATSGAAGLPEAAGAGGGAGGQDASSLHVTAQLQIAAAQERGGTSAAPLKAAQTPTSHHEGRLDEPAKPTKPTGQAWHLSNLDTKPVRSRS